MNSKSFFSLAPDWMFLLRALMAVVVCTTVAVPVARAGGEAPAWMHALVNEPLPPHNEKNEAILLYSQQIVAVESADKVKTTVREAYKILRPEGRRYGIVHVYLNSHSKLSGIRGWCIPAQGRDYEVKDKDAIETSDPAIPGFELITDAKLKALQIPAADPGNIVGYEYEKIEQPVALQDVWMFQERVPVREAHYALQLPSGWEYKSTWLNFAETKPSQTGQQWEWVVRGVGGLEHEDHMPPQRGVAGQMIIAFYPAGGALPGKTFGDWQQMGSWYENLARGRRESSQELKDKAKAITQSAATPVDKMRTIARFLQQEVRYVAIELGIGGWQPHAAPEVFAHRYGDCKDKATLMAAMLEQIGIQSYTVVINTHRGAVGPQTQAYLGAFNHVILAIKLPEGAEGPWLLATMQHPKLGRILFFDPTDQLTPFGEIRGALQANYGLLVTPGGGELVALPTQPPQMNGIARTAKFTIDARGTLTGDVEEIRRGAFAAEQRENLRTVSKDTDKIKPIETLLSHSFGTFQITRAAVVNAQQTDQPFAYRYSVVAEAYAKPAGNLVLVRPRVVGNKATGFLETKEPRRFPVEFTELRRDTDVFDITLPQGYEVDDLPPPVSAEYSFGSYHSKSEVNGNVLRYTRTLEIKELSVPVSKVDDLRKFYRIIATDERNTAVLKPARQ